VFVFCSLPVSYKDEKTLECSVLLTPTRITAGALRPVGTPCGPPAISSLGHGFWELGGARVCFVYGAREGGFVVICGQALAWLGSSKERTVSRVWTRWGGVWVFRLRSGSCRILCGSHIKTLWTRLSCLGVGHTSGFTVVGVWRCGRKVPRCCALDGLCFYG